MPEDVYSFTFPSCFSLSLTVGVSCVVMAWLLNMRAIEACLSVLTMFRETLVIEGFGRLVLFANTLSGSRWWPTVVHALVLQHWMSPLPSMNLLSCSSVPVSATPLVRVDRGGALGSSFLMTLLLQQLCTVKLPLVQQLFAQEAGWLTTEFPASWTAALPATMPAWTAMAPDRSSLTFLWTARTVPDVRLPISMAAAPLVGTRCTSLITPLIPSPMLSASSLSWLKVVRRLLARLSVTSDRMTRLSSPLAPSLHVLVEVLVLLPSTFTRRVSRTHRLWVSRMTGATRLSFLLPPVRVSTVPRVVLVMLPRVSAPLWFPLAPTLSASLPLSIVLDVPLKSDLSVTDVPDVLRVKLQQAPSVLTILFSVVSALPIVPPAVLKSLRRTALELVVPVDVLVALVSVLPLATRVVASFTSVLAVVPLVLVVLPAVRPKMPRRLVSVLQVVSDGPPYYRLTRPRSVVHLLVRVRIRLTVLPLFRTVPTQARRSTFTWLTVLVTLLHLSVYWSRKLLAHWSDESLESVPLKHLVVARLSRSVRASLLICRVVVRRLRVKLNNVRLVVATVTFYGFLSRLTMLSFTAPNLATMFEA